MNSKSDELSPDLLQHVAQCEQHLDIELQDKQLLHQALLHASGSNNRLESNERLEFLGDAVLGFICCELLFRKYPNWLEGELTRIKSVVVSRRTCTKLCAQLGIEQFLLVGKGIAGDEEMPASLLANVFESVLGAIFLDQGMPAVRRFLEPILLDEIDNAVAGRLETNHKSALQQLAQKKFGRPPGYVLVEEQGPDHNKCFRIAARVGNRDFAAAWGNNKKQAEQRAAANALAEMAGEEIPYGHSMEQEPEEFGTDA